jgi:hypothetical protein
MGNLYMHPYVARAAHSHSNEGSQRRRFLNLSTTATLIIYASKLPGYGACDSSIWQMRLSDQVPLCEACVNM